MKLCFGAVKEFDAKKKRLRVEITLDGGSIISPWLFAAVEKSKGDKTESPFDLDEHVACILNESLDEGIVVAAYYSDDDSPGTASANKYRKEFKDGTVLEYDREKHELTADVKGKVEIKASGTINIEATGKTTVKGTMVDIDGGPGAQFGCLHANSPCPFFGAVHLMPSNTVKVSP
jgi:phage baseplate assembly protein V